MRYIQNGTILNLRIALFSGRRKLDPADLGISAPPKDVISLGSLKVFDPGELAPFSSMKEKARKTGLRFGTRFFGSSNLFFIADANVDATVRELSGLQAEFLAQKNALVPRAKQIMNDWIAKHPQFTTAITAKAFTEAYIDEQLGFDFEWFKIAIPDEGTAAYASLADKLDSLPRSMFAEIAEEARMVMGKSFAGAEKVTHKALGPLKRIRCKLEALGFLTPAAAPLITKIDATMLAMPAIGGYIDGLCFGALRDTYALFADINRAANYHKTVLQPAVEEPDLVAMPPRAQQPQAQPACYL